MNIILRVSLALCLTLALVGGAICDTYQVAWYSINSGGGAASGGNYRLTGSVGQSVAGYASSASNLHWIGFWAGDLPVPVVPPSIDDAKMLPDGTYVSLSGRIATSAASDFSGFFYIEESNRTSGIRVAASGSLVSGLVRGSIVNVVGTLGTTPAGERQLTGQIVVIAGTQTPLGPLGMPNRSVGGGNIGTPPLGMYGVTGGVGLNNIGLLIQTWGKVLEVNSTYMVITDGSMETVRVSTTGLSVLPSVDDYVTVIGISSLDKPGADRLRYVLPRGNTDVR